MHGFNFWDELKASTTSNTSLVAGLPAHPPTDRTGHPCQEELNLSGVDICGGEWAFNLWEYTPAK